MFLEIILYRCCRHVLHYGHNHGMQVLTTTELSIIILPVMSVYKIYILGRFQEALFVIEQCGWCILYSDQWASNGCYIWSVVIYCFKSTADTSGKLNIFSTCKYKGDFNKNRRVPLMQQELSTFLRHLNSPQF